MPTVFSKIISGEIPAYKVAENDQFLSFLDINPIIKGHTLVIPKIETDYIFDIEDETFQQLWLFAKSVALKMKKVLPCKRIGIAVIGLEVPHAHIHLVPMNHMGDINFSNPKLSFSPEEMQAVTELIRTA